MASEPCVTPPGAPTGPINNTDVYNRLNKGCGVIDKKVTILTLVDHGNVIRIGLHQPLELLRAADSNTHRGGINGNGWHRAQTQGTGDEPYDSGCSQP